MVSKKDPSRKETAPFCENSPENINILVGQFLFCYCITLTFFFNSQSFILATLIRWHFLPKAFDTSQTGASFHICLLWQLNIFQMIPNFGIILVNDGYICKWVNVNGLIISERGLNRIRLDTQLWDFTQYLLGMGKFNIIAISGLHSNTGSEMSYPMCKSSPCHVLVTCLSTSETSEDLRTEFL